MVSVRMKSPGCGGFFMGRAFGYSLPVTKRVLCGIELSARAVPVSPVKIMERRMH